jgi:mono/diheme cytochrome c family protein
MRPIAAMAALLAVPLGLFACTPQRADVGRAFFTANCAACHGEDGRGGELAMDLPRPVPDLTTIAARNGGVFDRNAVMSMIDGYYRRDDPNHPMPEFGATMEGRVVMVETEPGVFSPTPEVLVGLADYLQSLQR